MTSITKGRAWWNSDSESSPLVIKDLCIVNAGLSSGKNWIMTGPAHTYIQQPNSIGSAR
jgi:hypothetical protein